MTKITAKAPEIFLPEWAVDQYKQTFPVCFNLLSSRANTLLVTWGADGTAGAPSVITSTAEMGRLLIFSHQCFPIFLFASKQHRSMEEAHGLLSISLQANFKNIHALCYSYN